MLIIALIFSTVRVSRILLQNKTYQGFIVFFCTWRSECSSLFAEIALIFPAVMVSRILLQNKTYRGFIFFCCAWRSEYSLSHLAFILLAFIFSISQLTAKVIWRRHNIHPVTSTSLTDCQVKGIGKAEVRRVEFTTVVVNSTLLTSAFPIPFTSVFPIFFKYKTDVHQGQSVRLVLVTGWTLCLLHMTFAVNWEMLKMNANKMNAFKSIS